MSAFHRVIFSTFLLLALGCFWASSAFALQTLQYYADAYGACTSSLESTCSGSFNKTYISNDTVKFTYNGCSVTSNPRIYNLNYTRKAYSRASDGSFVLGSTTDSSSFGASEQSLTCQDGEDLKLVGCNATCVPDPCKAAKGRTFPKVVSCGSVACPNDGTFQGNIGGMACSSGKPIFNQTPLGFADDGTCAGADPKLSSSTGMIRVLAKGLKSTTAYCHATYTYTGNKVVNNSEASPNDLSPLLFVDAVPTTEDGSCPATYPKKGQVNGVWVCLPAGDLGENPCPTGQITNNNGVCVPIAEAGTCPDNATRDPVTGNCPTGEPDPNPDTGDGDNPDTDTGGGGGGGGGGSSGSGDDSGGSGSEDSTPSSTNGDAKPGASSTGANSGACKDKPVCSGDPLMCASIEQTWRSGCESTKALLDVSQGQIDQSNADIKGSKDNFNAIKAAKETSATGFFSDFKTKATTSNNASCIQDASFPVMGKSLVVPFSKACDFFKFLRVLVIFSAYMLAARIVFGGIL